jgi:dolichol kinase
VTGAARLSLGREFARKAIHLATASLPVGWGLGGISLATLRTSLTVAVLVALIAEVARFRHGAFGAWFDRRLGTMLREAERRELSGATWLAVAMWGAVWLAPPAAALCALWAGAVGDATAAVVGRAYGAWRAVSGKTLVGSAAAVASTALGVLWLTAATPLHAVALGLAAAAAEWPARPGNDNLRVVGAVALAATLLGFR